MCCILGLGVDKYQEPRQDSRVMKIIEYIKIK